MRVLIDGIYMPAWLYKRSDRRT